MVIYRVWKGAPYFESQAWSQAGVHTYIQPPTPGVLEGVVPNSADMTATQAHTLPLIPSSSSIKATCRLADGPAQLQTHKHTHTQPGRTAPQAEAEEGAARQLIDRCWPPLRLVVVLKGLWKVGGEMRGRQHHLYTGARPDNMRRSQPKLECANKGSSSSAR